MWNVLFIILLLVSLAPLTYLFAMALGSIRAPREGAQPPAEKYHTFIIAIAAHDEAAVIERTVRRMLAMNYPADRFSVHVVADHCTDDTAELAERAGAVAHPRAVEPRSGKGAALSWLFEQIWQSGAAVDAIVIFDADTAVDPDFLRWMNLRLLRGDKVIQGRHIISNPGKGWFPSLTWAMFIIDNRFQNLGRANLGWSAKHMGDSICFQAAVLKQIGWGGGLTEDYQLRQQLLLDGIRIAYEPRAKGYGEAPVSLAWAGRQRARWLRGTHDANRQLAPALFGKWLRTRDPALLDGVLQARMPSYSTVSLLAALVLAALLAVHFLVSPVYPWLIAAWIVAALALALYPFFGLALERAPLRAYLVILTGPAYILWRSWLALKSRYLQKKVVWVRTAHGS